ncbi:class A beta-lactamase [Parvularcula maris]|uniref:Beta-lactamase n=1 Tax=Parvularcula maris TaxID=2965077 RepID=A0A9X2RHE3_9PROT|nr:class A beta-lactamase [Parvularcula maris]MCQ8183796.1 class A beta-lactamase [Parvularcula maris]
MFPSLNRRSALTSALAALLVGGQSAASPARLAGIEKALGGRLGVYAAQASNPFTLSNRAGERFAMCSTFKAPLAGLILDEMANGGLSPDQSVPIGETELIGYSPEVEARLSAGLGHMSAMGLCRAAVVVSDNTAANLLLDLIGGPAGFTERVRRIEATTRLDRIEPGLNENAAGDPRDTTTPRGMAQLLERMLYGGALSAAASSELRAMMIDCRTGGRRLRAGLPDLPRTGDKTGTSLNGLYGDIAFIEPEGRAPMVIACYIDASSLPGSAADQAHAEVGRLAGETFRLG